MMKHIINNKKGVELTLQTIVIVIISLIAVIMIIYLFTNHYSSNAEVIGNAGKEALKDSLF